MDTSEATAILASFFASGNEFSFKRRSPIIHIHEHSKYVYWIMKGVVRAYSYSPGGDTVVHYLDKKGELFPLNQLFENASLEIGYAAFNDTIVQRKLFSELFTLLRDQPLTLMALLEQEGDVYDRIMTLNTNPAEKRLAKWLLNLCGQFGNAQDERVDIDLAATVQELADCVRLSRESAGKILHDLECDGSVIVGSQHIMIYPQRLRDYIQ